MVVITMEAGWMEKKADREYNCTRTGINILASGKMTNPPGVEIFLKQVIYQKIYFKFSQNSLFKVGFRVIKYFHKTVEMDFKVEVLNWYCLLVNRQQLISRKLSFFFYF
jgi:hypothetical protein